MSREGPVPCRSSAMSASSSSARERETGFGLPDKPTTGAVTVSSSKSDRQKAIGRDSNRGVAADHGASFGAGAPRCLSPLIPHADAPDGPLPVQHMEQQTPQHISMVTGFIACET